MYSIKHVEDYQNIIKTSNRNTQFKGIWRNCFAPKKYIGDNNYLCEKYRVMDKFMETSSFYDTLVYFIERYLSDYTPEYDYVSVRDNLTCRGLQRTFMHCGRSDAQIGDMAARIGDECAKLGVRLDGRVETDVEKMKDLIIGHACYETLVGYYNEAYVRKYLTEKCGKNLNTLVDGEETDTILDSNGVDIFVSDENNKIKALIQVKPITFITGRDSEDLKKDRAKCYNNDKRMADYVKKNPDKFSDETPLEWYYIFYDKKITDKGNFEFDDESIIMFSDNIITDGTNNVFVKKEYLWDNKGDTLFDGDFINKNIKRFSLFKKV